MLTQQQSPKKQDIVYPESDGKPMADNTEQFRWIVMIKENLELLFAAGPDVFVAGDLLWYPVEGNSSLNRAPDVMVVFGRPKGKRGSYLQWLEDNIAPQVVFEILSPNNTLTEMGKKFQFYDRYGVEEYYLYDPAKADLSGWLRSESQLQVIEPIEGWISPRLGIHFDLSGEELQIYGSDGGKFLTFVELDRLRQQEQQEKELAQQRAETEHQRAETERQRAEQAETELQQEQQRRQAMEARLREMGIDPNQL
ncbi:Uma2 family endonuclease [Microcoleus sp. FACHB-672]|uniref:Uma2 family endonuclease n=1 Tax=Microcoleus sp. FACHB-672 TaxID=2692825 RepID=UPI001685D432|nr:Uma2 family endonuclease [Microcoleus sp. FACHB-672]MBD2040829.1 Uma2 family endonuclease [Microcoleus sp. FACHB-672]